MANGPPFTSRNGPPFALVFTVIPFVLRRPRLFILYFVPFLVNAALFLTLWYLALTHLLPELTGHLPAGDWWWTALRAVIGGLLAIVLLTLSVLVYAPLGNLLGAPFADLLSRAVGRVQNEPPPATDSFPRELLRSAVTAAAMLLVALLLQGTCLLLNFIPVAGPFLAVGTSLLLGAFLNGINAFAFVLERRGMGFGAKLRWSITHAPTTFAIGAAVTIQAVFPLIGFLAMHNGAAAATVHFCRLSATER